MRFNTYTLLFAIIPFVGYAQSESEEINAKEFSDPCLFEEKSITVGLGASYSIILESVGVNSRVYYNLGEHICFGPEFSFFKKGEEKAYDIDIISHYIFDTKFAGLYPLLGVNYTIEESVHHTKKEIGVVFGAGAHRNFKKLNVFAEYSHVESKLADDFITVGLMINLK